MKTNQTFTLHFKILLSFLSILAYSNGYKVYSQQIIKKNPTKYIVAAYVWPSCHDEPRSREKLWGEGIGEWEIIKKGSPRFEGHYQPRIPLWGYKMDDDPKAWEQKIGAATSHGVNTFIFDWYWYDNKPFLEEAIDKGFLGAKNNTKMNFYLMWANHDVPGNMWNHIRYKSDSIIWNGEVDQTNFKIIVDRIINRFFKKINYLKINNEPVFSIYSLADLLNSFGTLNEAAAALDYFRREVKKAGFKGLHLQLIGGDKNGEPYFRGTTEELNTVINVLGVNSVTLYNMAGSTYRKEDYLRYNEGAILLRNKWDSILAVPFFPIVSVGWDNTPRYPKLGKESVIHFHNTPQSFAAYLQKAKEFADKHPEQFRLIIINAWNEWVEGSYLEPDMKWGYGYLEAVKNVMSGKYDKYTNQILQKQ
ncbi:MAG: glycoside hydrolase family 99-like domain-containing protein [Prolixibacteraceae bacterium]